MSQHSFSVTELSDHSAAISGIAQDTRATAAKADAVNLGDASYGVIVGPIAVTAGRALLEAYAQVGNSLADTIEASAEGMKGTSAAYAQAEQANADAGTSISRDVEVQL